jgi:hypothetical protein
MMSGRCSRDGSLRRGTYPSVGAAETHGTGEGETKMDDET